MLSRLACALLVACAALQAACASMCRELAADRKAFFARRALSSGPHAVIVVPFAVADRLIARRLAAAHLTGSPIALPGRLGTYLGSVRIVPRRLALRPAPADRVGLRVELDILAGDRPLVAMTLDVDLRPHFDSDKGTLLVALRADDLRSLRPRISREAAGAFAEEIRARLPSVARAAIGKEEIASLARSAIDTLGDHLGDLLIDSGLAAPLGELTRVSVHIPIVPVSRMALRSLRQGALVAEIHTSLPAAAGVQVPAVGQLVAVRLSGEALAELGNRALSTGLLPQRYDDKMHPKKDGDFTPGLRVVAGRRPFKIIAWRVKSPCLRARIGADPVVGLRAGALVVGFEHGEVEEVRGSMLVRARVWLKRLGADAIRFSKETLSSAQVSIAGAPLTGTIERAFYRQGVLGFDVAVE